MTLVVELLAVLALGGLAVYHGVNAAMIVLAVRELRRQRWMEPRRLAAIALESSSLPGVTVVVPAYNEAVSIVRTVQSILRTAYRDLEIVVVSDGSTDQTLAVLARAFALRPSNVRAAGTLPTQAVRAVFESAADARLFVIDKRNGGKADALNAGINMASKPLVLAVDADVVLDRFSIVHLALPFALDSTIVASSGMVRPHNGCDIRRGRVSRVRMPSPWTERLQILEYIRAYGIGRLFFNRFNAHLIISGAFGLFDRALLLDIGGYQPHAIAEDMELVVRIHRYCADREQPYRVWFAADALCWTEAPHTLRDLGAQRTRWHHGLLAVLRAHRRMALDRRYGAAGALAFPIFGFELYAPVFEMLSWVVVPALWAAGALSVAWIAAWFAVAVFLSAGVSLAAVFLDTLGFGVFRHPIDRLALVACAVLEHVGYRQLTVYFRLRAFYRDFRTIQLKSGWRSPARMPAP